MTTISACVPVGSTSSDDTATMIQDAAQSLGIEVSIVAYITTCKIVFKNRNDLNLMVVSGILEPLNDDFVGKKAYRFHV